MHFTASAANTASAVLNLLGAIPYDVFEAFPCRRRPCLAFGRVALPAREIAVNLAASDDGFRLIHENHKQKRLPGARANWNRRNKSTALCPLVGVCCFRFFMYLFVAGIPHRERSRSISIIPNVLSNHSRSVLKFQDDIFVNSFERISYRQSVICELSKPCQH